MTLVYVRPCLFTIDDSPERYTAVKILQANGQDRTLADLLYNLINADVGASVIYGGGAAAEFRITKVR